MSRKREQSKREKRPILETFGKRFEIDADMIRGGDWVEIRGRSRVEIGGVKKIKSYSDTCVVLLLDCETLAVCGSRLECVFYRRGEAAVEGHIDSVSFGE